MLSRISATLLVLLFAWATPGIAENKGDISDLFCKKMEEQGQYDKNNFESYKMLIPGDNGWIFRTETDLRTDFSFTPVGLQNIIDLNAAMKSKGIELVMLLTPTRGLIHSENLRAEDRKKYDFSVDKAWKSYWDSIHTLQKQGIVVIGLQRPKAGDSFFYKRDHHWNASGSKIAAVAVSDYIKKMPAYEKISKISFMAKEGKPAEFLGVSKKVFKKLCNTSQEPETIIERYTERADETTGQDELFGDNPTPEIVLMGTSNSTQEPSFSNFAGFLKEELSADILNTSVSGGGLDTGMLVYLGSEDFRTAPAKIAIWEVPSYYVISNHGNFFSEAIPAIYGVCETALAEVKNLKITEKNMIVLSKLADKDISGKKNYLYLNFQNPVSKAFSADIRYVKDRTKYRFSHSNRYPQDKSFFLRLDNNDSALDKIILTVPPEMIGNIIEAKVCAQP